MEFLITPDGDIQYYATPSYVTNLTPEHFLGSNSVLSAENDLGYFPVEAISTDNVAIMASNRNMGTTPTLIDDMHYTKGTEVLGVSEQETVSIVMYPNPAANYLFVKGLNTKASYTVFDGLGRAIKSGTVSSSSDKINVNTLSKGVYFLKLKGHNNMTFIKK